MILKELIKPRDTIRPAVPIAVKNDKPNFGEVNAGRLSGHSFHQPLIVSGSVVDCARHFTRGTLSIFASEIVISTGKTAAPAAAHFRAIPRL
jgi:hypothetical protein